MNIIEEGGKAKVKIADAIEAWALDIVDGMVAGSPKLAVAGVYVKNGIRNYRKREECKWDKMIDDVSLFIADEKGEVNLDKVFSDGMQVLKDMDEMPISLGLFDGTIGKGSIKIHIPDNIITRTLFGDMGAIIIGESDFKQLKEALS